MTDFTKKKLLKGISLVEALVSTAIVAIGFLAVFQLVNYSVGSINVSGERTKMNYITTMIAEDIIGSRNSLSGMDPATSKVQIGKLNKPINADGTDSDLEKFSQTLVDNEYYVSSCSGRQGQIISKDEIKNIYLNNKNKSAPENKKERWKKILENDRYLKCRKDGTGTKDIKSIEVFKICGSTEGGCLKGSGQVFDEMYIGRVQLNTNDGKKRKVLYFQADYIYKE